MRADRQWRVLVHKNGSSPSIGISNRMRVGGSDGPYDQHIVMQDAQFDEVVLGSWLHVEELGDGAWMVRIGDEVTTVTVGRDGKAASVRREGAA